MGLSTGEEKPDLEGLHIPASTGQDSSSIPPSADVSASAEAIRQRKTRSDIGKSRGPRGTQSTAGISQISQVQFAQLYKPEIWQKALCAPADAMAAISGKAHWEITEKERDAIGVTSSIAAQCFAVTDAKYLALALAVITVLDVYGIRLILDLADRRKAEKERKDALRK